LDLGSYSILREQSLHQRGGVHTLHLLVDDEIDVGLVVDFGRLQETSNSTIAENDVLRVVVGLGGEGHRYDGLEIRRGLHQRSPQGRQKGSERRSRDGQPQPWC
jgi:hypothetical protein